MASDQSAPAPSQGGQPSSPGRMSRNSWIIIALAGLAVVLVLYGIQISRDRSELRSNLQVVEQERDDLTSRVAELETELAASVPANCVVTLGGECLSITQVGATLRDLAASSLESLPIPSLSGNSGNELVDQLVGCATAIWDNGDWRGICTRAALGLVALGVLP